MAVHLCDGRDHVNGALGLAVMAQRGGWSYAGVFFSVLCRAKKGTRELKQHGRTEEQGLGIFCVLHGISFLSCCNLPTPLNCFKGHIIGAFFNPLF